MIVPGERGGYVVGIDTETGDHVPLAALPLAYGTMEGAGWSGDGLTFRWAYFRSPEQGQATLAFGDDGRGTVTFAFSGDEPEQGSTVAGAMAIVGRDGEAIHTIYAMAHVSGEAAVQGRLSHRSAAPVDLPARRWAEVTGFTVFTMKYYAIQELGRDEIAAAMRRAVHRVTQGTGSEQWLGWAGG